MKQTVRDLSAIILMRTDHMAAQHTLSNLTDGQPDSFALGDGDNLVSYLSTEFGCWDSSTLASPIQQVPWTYKVRPSDQRNGIPSFRMPPNVGTTTPVLCAEAPCLTNYWAGIAVNKRVGSVIRYLETIGFKNFDELIRTYYSHKFREGSFFCN